MTDKPPPKRIDSELTLSIDKEKLSAAARDALAKAQEELKIRESKPIDPHDEDALEIARENLRSRPTLEPCPACVHCDFCRNPQGISDHMVTPERAAEFRAETVPEAEDQ